MSETTTRVDPEALLAHGDFVRGIARSLLFDEHAAQDVVQETWLAALGANPTASRGWLAVVARNLAIKRLRGDKRREARETAVARPERVPSEADVRARERICREVVDEVLALPEPYRATILLRYFESLPPRAVAQRMGAPVETVRTRTRRAIEMLRVRLDARHGQDRDGLCAALLLWSGRRSARTGSAAAAGGMIMGVKTVVAGVGVAVLALCAYLVWPREGTGTTSSEAAPSARQSAAAPSSPTPRTRTAGDPAAGAPAGAAAPETPTPTTFPVRGRVVDADGRPAVDVEVWVAGPEVLPPDASGKRISGTIPLKTGADGRFETILTSSAQCTVRPRPQPEFEPRKDDERVVTPPAEGIEFVVDRKPTATLVVTAYDVAAAQPVRDFVCRLDGKGLGFMQRASSEAKVEAVVRLAATAGDNVKVTVDVAGTTASRDVAVRAGERVEVRLDVQHEGVVVGHVVDAAGRPLANAMVFFGGQDVGRGDEPFKPFDEKRVPGAVRTGPDGRFELRGTGRSVTFWHADTSPVTVLAADAGNVILPPRGSIRGVVRDAAGTPVASRKVYVDRVRETTTDGAGRFEFDKVEAGTRGLSFEAGKPKAYVAVCVSAGEAAEVELRPGLPKVTLRWPGRTEFSRHGVALVPLSPVGSLAIAQAGPDGNLLVQDVLPGRYLVLCDGAPPGVATVDVSGPEATVAAGKGEVVVRTALKKRVYVVPAGSGSLCELLAGRAASQSASADGVARFTGLAPGRYDVGVELGGVRATVDVADLPVDATIE